LEKLLADKVKTRGQHESAMAGFRSKNPLDTIDCPGCGARVKVMPGAQTGRCAACLANLDISADDDGVMENPGRLPKVRIDTLKEGDQFKHPRFQTIFRVLRRTKSKSGGTIIVARNLNNFTGREDSFPGGTKVTNQNANPGGPGYTEGGPTAGSGHR